MIEHQMERVSLSLQTYCLLNTFYNENNKLKALKHPFHPLIPMFASNNKRTSDRSLRNPYIKFFIKFSST